jgi:hypothetical protein
MTDMGAKPAPVEDRVAERSLSDAPIGVSGDLNGKPNR